MLDIVSIITSFDNLPLLKVSIPILREDPLVNRIVVVNQQSEDGTEEWLAKQPDIIAVNRINDGASRGRNAGLNAAGKFDYAIQLDGGMRPLKPSLKPMLDFLERRDDVDVLGLAWHDLETDPKKAWRRWPYNVITDEMTYQYRALSLTNYCLAKWSAWDGIRMDDSGPLGKKGWGGDDNILAYQWIEAGIVVHCVPGVMAYRRGSGSFRRLFRETGIWPSQYGSNYEERVVYMHQKWPHMSPPGQWGEPWLTVVVKVGEDWHEACKTIKLAHEELRKRRWDPPWHRDWNPYHVIAWCPDENREFLEWAELHRLRQHHGDTTVLADGTIVRKGNDDEGIWTGDFILSTAEDYHDDLAWWVKYYGMVENREELMGLMGVYNEAWPWTGGSEKPDTEMVELRWGER